MVFIDPYQSGGEGVEHCELPEGTGPLGALSTPVSPKFVEGTGRVMNTIPPADFSFWEMLNEAVQARRWLRDGVLRSRAA